MDDIPTIAYWMGVPLAEVPRDELERQFCAAHAKIQRLERDLFGLSMAEIRGMAEAAKQRVILQTKVKTA